MTWSLWENACRLFYRGTWVSLDLGALRGPGTHPLWRQGNDCMAVNEEQLGILTKNTPPSAMASHVTNSSMGAWDPCSSAARTHSRASGETHLVPREMQHCPDASSSQLIWRFQVTPVETPAKLVQPQFTSGFHPAFTSVKVKPKPQTPNQAAWSWTRDTCQSYLWSHFFLSVWWISVVCLHFYFDESILGGKKGKDVRYRKTVNLPRGRREATLESGQVGRDLVCEGPWCFSGQLCRAWAGRVAWGDAQVPGVGAGRPGAPVPTAATRLRGPMSPASWGQVQLRCHGPGCPRVSTDIAAAKLLNALPWRRILTYLWITYKHIFDHITIAHEL